MRVCDVRSGVGLAVAALSIGLMTMTAAAQKGNPAAAKLKNPVAVTPASLEAGKKTFVRNCRGCHGSTGEGGPQGESGAAPPNLTDAKWDHGASDGEIFTVIKAGVAPDFAMEAWGDRINDAELWNVVNFVRSLSKAK